MTDEQGLTPLEMAVADRFVGLYELQSLTIARVFEHRVADGLITEHEVVEALRQMRSLAANSHAQRALDALIEEASKRAHPPFVVIEGRR